MLTYDEEVELKKGESGMQSSSSSDGRDGDDNQHAEALFKDLMGEPDEKLPAAITRTIDLDGIGVTGQDELNEISRSSRGDVVYDPPKNDEVFESELKSIFGRIKFKAQELKTKFTKSGADDSSVSSSLVNTPAEASRADRDSLALSQDRSKSTARGNEEIEDPLKGLALDLSSEVSAEETLRKKNTD